MALIERKTTAKRLYKDFCPETAAKLEKYLNELPTVDAVPRSEYEKVLRERDKAIADLARYSDCKTCNQHCGGCNFELVVPEPCEYGWEWKGV